MLVANYDAKIASKQIRRILNDPKRQQLKSIIGNPVRINGLGALTYTATGQQMHRILMCLPPGRFSDAYMDECARVLWMRDTGDQRLIDEVHHNRTTAIANGGVPTMGSLFGPCVPDVTAQVQPPELSAASTKRGIAMMEAEVEERQLMLVERRASLRRDNEEHGLRVCREIEEIRVLHTQGLQASWQLLGELDLQDDHSSFAFRDSIHNFDPRLMISVAQRSIAPAEGAPAEGAAAEGALCETLESSGPVHAQAGNLLQIHEILEHVMGVGASTAARVSRSFGTEISKMFKARHGRLGPEKKREINGLKKFVRAYAPGDVEWIREQLTKMLAEDEQARKKK